MVEQTKPNRWIPKGDMATVISAFVVVSGVLGAFLDLPTSELIIGAGLGFLFRGVVKN